MAARRAGREKWCVSAVGLARCFTSLQRVRDRTVDIQHFAVAHSRQPPREARFDGEKDVPVAYVGSKASPGSGRVRSLVVPMVVSVGRASELTEPPPSHRPTRTAQPRRRSRPVPRINRESSGGRDQRRFPASARGRREAGHRRHGRDRGQRASSAGPPRPIRRLKWRRRPTDYDQYRVCVPVRPTETRTAEHHSPAGHRIVDEAERGAAGRSAHAIEKHRSFVVLVDAPPQPGSPFASRTWHSVAIRR